MYDTATTHDTATGHDAASRRPLVITSGEPAGIGPELICKLAASDGRCHAERFFSWVAMGNLPLLRKTAESLNLDLRIRAWQGESLPAEAEPNLLWVKDIPLAAQVLPGKLDPRNAAAVIASLEQAARGCLAGDFSAMVTAPVQKSVINDAGIAFTGHTEFLCDLAGVDQVVMMLATEHLRVALVTTHLPLREVADAITPELLQNTLNILQRSLVNDFNIAKPSILVAGLNPHAGEAGHLGREELDIMIPVLDRLRRQGMNLSGPLPADTLFTRHSLEGADAVLAMYHDQGLPVLKYQGFGEAVNITLGLPFIRTSVDHGTALSIAGQNKAQLGSLLSAVNAAQSLICAREARLAHV